jgi:hypothetical protein
MNANNVKSESEPITGDGILWAIKTLRERFEKAANLPPKEEKEAVEQPREPDRTTL